MRKFLGIPYITGLVLLLVFAACGKSKTEDPMAQLATLKEQKTALETQINALEKRT